MTTITSRAARPLAATVAMLIAAAGLSIAPIAAASASASSQTVSIADAANNIRTLNGAAVFKTNGFVSKAAQDSAAAYATCGVACIDANQSTLPAGAVNTQFHHASASGGTSSSRLAAIKSALLADPDVIFSSGVNTAGVGYVTKGTKSYGILLTVFYTNPPLDLLVASVPTISGSARVGSTLHAKVTTTPVADVLFYEWMRGATPVQTSTNANYEITPDDLGARITVTVTATKAGYVSTAGTSAKTATIAKGIFTKGKPAVGGYFNVGQILFAGTGTWAPTPGSYSYQWLRNGKVIPGEYSSIYTLTAADKGKRIDVTIGASRLGFVPASATTKTSKTVAGTLMYSLNPMGISGERTVGQTLTALPGLWSTDNVSFSYAWRVNGKTVTGATKQTFIIPASAVNKKVSVKITAKKVGFATATAALTPTEAIAPREFTTLGTASIVGTQATGKTVTAVSTGWSPTPTSYTYVWSRNGVPIAGATGKTHKVVAADINTTMTVSIVGKRLGYVDSGIHATVVGFAK